MVCKLYVKLLWLWLRAACRVLHTSLTATLQDVDIPADSRHRHLTAVKMTLYLLCQFMEMYEAEACQANPVMVKKVGKWTTSSFGTGLLFCFNKGWKSDFFFKSIKMCYLFWHGSPHKDIFAFICRVSEGKFLILALIKQKILYIAISITL